MKITTQWMKKNHIIEQCMPIALLFALFWNLALRSSYTIKEQLGLILIKTILLNLFFVCTFLYVIYRYVIRKSAFKTVMLPWIRDNWTVVLLLVIFAATSLQCIQFWLMNDGYEYYRGIRTVRAWDFTNFLGLKICGHSTSFLLVWYLIGEYLLPDFTYGVRIVIIFMALLTILALYGILRQLFAEISKIEIALLLASFAFSPFVWGMIGEINIDFPVMCAFVWMFYFHLKGWYVLHAYAAALLCFSKENGLVIYGCYMLGWVIGRIVFHRKNGMRQMVKTVLAPEILLACAGGLMWIYQYFFVSRGAMWAGTDSQMTADATSALSAKYNAFSPSFVYMVQKLKEMLFVDYQWIYALMLIVLAVYYFKDKKIYVENAGREKWFAWIGGMAGFYNFSLWFVTWVNHRYILTLIFFEIIVAAFFFFGILKSGRKRRWGLILMIGITLLSNFVSDPFSSLFFDRVNLGNGTMTDVCRFHCEGDQFVYDTDGNSQSDGGYADTSVTNRQYVYRGLCFDKLLKQIDYDEDTLIVIPCVYQMDGMEFLYGTHLDNSQYQMYVNADTKRLCVNNREINLSDNTDWLEFHAVYLNEDEQLDKSMYKKYEKIYYVYPPMNDEFDETKFLSHYSILNKQVIRKNRTEFDVYRIK